MALTKIPDHAKLVHQGPIFKIYQWQQEMFDGSFSRFEKAVKSDSVFCLPVVGDKIILVKERQPLTDRYIGMIGGSVNKGLTCEETMKAELLEEGGIIVDSLQLYKSYPNPRKVAFTQHIYIARGCELTGKQSLDPGGEEIEILSMNFDDFVEYMIEDKYNTLLFKTDIMRMKINGTLDTFKQLLFDNA